MPLLSPPSPPPKPSVPLPPPPRPPIPPSPPPSPGATNIARNGTASASSALASSYDFSRVIINGAPWTANGCSNNFGHTADNDLWPWVAIDLRRVARIFSVTIYNRADCCQDRLPSFVLYATNTSLTSPGVAATGLLSAMSPSSVCASGKPPADWLAGQTPSFTVTCGRVARYVTLQRTDGVRTINLCQIEVTGL